MSLLEVAEKFVVVGWRGWVGNTWLLCLTPMLVALELLWVALSCRRVLTIMSNYLPPCQVTFNYLQTTRATRKPSILFTNYIWFFGIGYFRDSEIPNKIKRFVCQSISQHVTFCLFDKQFLSHRKGGDKHFLLGGGGKYFMLEVVVPMMMLIMRWMWAKQTFLWAKRTFMWAKQASSPQELEFLGEVKMYNWSSMKKILNI